MRIVFMGTAPLAVASLEALAREAAFTVTAVVTQPDRPKGRDLRPQASAVKAAAVRLGLPVLQPEKAREAGFIETLRQQQADLMVVAAYGQILPQAILDLPKFGCLNVHTSLLPRWRGAAPIQWAIFSGDAETGVTIMKMDAGLDTGDILAMARTAIVPEDNASVLHDRLAAMGAELLVPTIKSYVAGALLPTKQPAEGVTYARKISKTDGQINWQQPARVLWNQVRAFTPWPGAFFHEHSGSRPLLVKLWEAELAESSGGVAGEILRADGQGIVVACGQGALRIKALQKEGGRRMSAAEFLAGHPLAPGSRWASEG